MPKKTVMTRRRKKGGGGTKEPRQRPRPSHPTHTAASLAPQAFAKLRAPQARATVPRTALFRQLDAARRRGQVVWVGAEAGAGKTTLAASYLATRRLRHIWYQFDERDVDPAAFFYYLREAVARIAPRARRVLPLLTPEYASGVEVYARNFFDQLGSLLRFPCHLVFDDYHLLPDDASVHTLLASGLTALPKTIGAHILSRNAPPAVFAALQVRRRLVRIDAGLLAFTPAETQALARRYRLPNLTPAAVGALHEQTGGWVAGMILMLEDAARTGAAAPQFEQPMTRTLFDYFAAEILQRVPPAQRKVLLATALLQEVSVEAAQTLSGEARAGRVFAEFVRKGYFISALGGRSPVYRFHPLFRQFLLARLRRDMTPAALADLHRRAAAVAGNPENALQLLADAGAWDQLIPALRATAKSLFGQGRIQTLTAWIERIPADLRHDDPWLRFWLGQCRLPYDPQAAGEELEEALKLFLRGQDRSGALLAWSGIVDGLFHRGCFAALDHWIDEYYRIAGDEPLPLEIHDFVSVRMFGALLVRQPHHSDIGMWCERADRVLQSGDDLPLRLLAGVHLCIYLAWIGDTTHARRCRRWLADLASADLQPLLYLLARATEGLHAAMVEADASLTREIVRDASTYAQETGVHVWDFHTVCHGTATALSVGDVAAAREQLQRLSKDVHRVRLLDVGYYHYLGAWEAAQSGRWADVESHVEAAAALRDAIGMVFNNAVLASMTARLHIERRRFDAARACLDEARKLAQATHSHLLTFAVSMDEAELALQQQDYTQMRDWLARGLAAARRQGLVNYYGWDPARMARLSAQALTYGIETEYVRALIRRRTLVPPAGTLVDDWPRAVRLYTLGRFSLIKDERPVQFEGKAQKKILDLLKALIALGGHNVPEHKICDALWPRAEADAARASLKVTLHRLRKLIGPDAIALRDAKLSLNAGVCWVDAWIFERAADELAVHGDSLPNLEITRLGDRMLSLYRGAFLGDDDFLFAAPVRERLRSKWMRAIDALAAHFQRAGMHDQAIAWYERGIEVDPLAESFYRGLMRTYRVQRRVAEGLGVYRRCKRVLAAELQVDPSPETEQLAHALRALGGDARAR